MREDVALVTHGVTVACEHVKTFLVVNDDEHCLVLVEAFVGETSHCDHKDRKVRGLAGEDGMGLS